MWWKSRDEGYADSRGGRGCHFDEGVGFGWVDGLCGRALRRLNDLFGDGDGEGGGCGGND